MMDDPIRIHSSSEQCLEKGRYLNIIKILLEMREKMNAHWQLRVSAPVLN